MSHVFQITCIYLIEIAFYFSNLIIMGVHEIVDVALKFESTYVKIRLHSICGICWIYIDLHFCVCEFINYRFSIVELQLFSTMAFRMTAHKCKKLQIVTLSMKI